MSAYYLIKLLMFVSRYCVSPPAPIASSDVVTTSVVPCP